MELSRLHFLILDLEEKKVFVLYLWLGSNYFDNYYLSILQNNSNFNNSKQVLPICIMYGSACYQNKQTANPFGYCGSKILLENIVYIRNGSQEYKEKSLSMTLYTLSLIPSTLPFSPYIEM